MIVVKTARGPASYATPGFTITVGELEEIEQSSGVMALVKASTSSYIREIVTASGNIVTVQCMDVRSGEAYEIADTTVLSNTEFTAIVSGH